MLKACDTLILSYDLYRVMLSGKWQIMSYYMVECYKVVGNNERYTVRKIKVHRLYFLHCFWSLAISCS